MLSKIKNIVIGVTLFFCGAYYTQQNQPQPIKTVVEVNRNEVFDESRKIEGILVSRCGMPTEQAEDVAPKIAKAAVSEKVPSEILTAVVKTESEFDPKAKSKTGSIGYAQIKPKFWKNETPYNIYDEDGNIMAGAYILRQYYEETGSWSNAVKAYNIGITDFKNGKNLNNAEKYHTKVSDNLEVIVAQGETPLRRL
jgi:hypothetical protein